MRCKLYKYKPRASDNINAKNEMMESSKLEKLN